jgi:hypothetical protein
MHSKIFRLTFVATAIALSPLSAYAQIQTLPVHIVHREEKKQELTATVPDFSSLKSSDKANADKTASEKNDTKPAQPPQKVTVTGATLTLRLPDRREVVVGCESKYALRFDYVNRRSCRVPPSDDVMAEFDGDQAKLIWPVSIDGRKTQSESYTIISIAPAHR